MSRDIVLVSGNGVLMDLGAAVADVGALPTQSPLSWAVPPGGSKSATWRDDFPAAWRAIDAIRQDAPELSDFEICDIVARNDSGRPDGVDERAEFRHLLARAFSFYQSVVNAQVLEHWSWFRLLERINERLMGVVSFNYDTTVEQVACSIAGDEATYLGVSEQGASKFPVWKPHGSVNFDIHPIIFSGIQDYPPAVTFERSDLKLTTVETEKLMKPRLAAEVVLPAESNIFANMQWNRPGNVWARHYLPEARVCVLAGLSYWPVDRKEIDALLSTLRPTAKVVVINPRPSPSMRMALKRSGRRTVYYDDAEDALERWC